MNNETAIKQLEALLETCSLSTQAADKLAELIEFMRLEK